MRAVSCHGVDVGDAPTMGSSDAPDPRTNQKNKITAGARATYPNAKPAIAIPRPDFLSLRVSATATCPTITAARQGTPSMHQPAKNPTRPNTSAHTAAVELGRAATTNIGGGGPYPYGPGLYGCGLTGNGWPCPGGNGPAGGRYGSDGGG